MQMLDAHGPALMGMLRRLSGSRPHDAEDAFQDAAVRIWRGFAGRPRLRNPRGWVMTIGYRALIDVRQGRRAHEPLPELADPGQSPAGAAAESSEASCRLNAALARLPDSVREVVVLHYFGGLTIRQTAAAMNLSPGTVKSRLNAGLVKLRSVLE
jgi:RNA polymerase sigma-70 factor (ECF subfamily)